MRKYHNSALWRTYLFIVGFSIIAASTFLYLKWLDIKHAANTEQTYANNLVTNSMEALLRKNETMLKVLGERLVELVAQGETSAAQIAVDAALASNPEFSAVGLAKPSGKIILASSNIAPPLVVPNLLSVDEVRESFEKSLLSDKLVMGRTYYMQPIDEWVIPIRLRIKNKKDEVSAVVMSAIRLGSVHSLWSSDSLPAHLKLVVVRKDLYRQYVSFLKPSEYSEWYDAAVHEKFLAFVDNSLKEQTGLTLSDIRRGQNSAEVTLPNKQGELLFNIITYDPVFQHYTITSTSIKSLLAEMVSPTSWLLILLLVFNIGLYLIFKLNGRLQWEAKQSLEFEVEHDSLTKLPNRKLLSKEFSAWSERFKTEFSLLFIDLSNFKSCNDLHGHSTGDQVLCEVAKRISLSFEGCLCVRQGGDEFIILSPATNQETLFNDCNAFLSKLTKVITLGHLEFSINANIGIAFSPKDGQSLNELLRKADMAMYEAKRKQRDIALYSEDLEQKTKQIAGIEKELRHALSSNEFSMVYQPQVDALSNEVLGLEALIRWHNAELGFVPPDQFIAVAEANGYIHAIGQFVIETALSECIDVCRQMASNPIKIRLSVNVSVRQLLSENFIDNLIATLKKYDRQAITFMIEVTESLFIEDMDSAKKVLDKANEFGIFVSLDDFGTGYSSLSVLSKLPINELKIDRSFVNDILVNEQDRLLAKSIINLSKSLAIPVVAEGVETKEQADMLAKHGCDIFQGYYFARPMKKEDLIKFLKNSQK